MIEHFFGVRGREAEADTRLDERSGRIPDNDHCDPALQHLAAEYAVIEKQSVSGIERGAVEIDSYP